MRGGQHDSATSWLFCEPDTPDGPYPSLWVRTVPLADGTYLAETVAGRLYDGSLLYGYDPDEIIDLAAVWVWTVTRCYAPHPDATPFAPPTQVGAGAVQASGMAGLTRAMGIADREGDRVAGRVADSMPRRGLLARLLGGGR
jgi:hypothetical protein